MHGRNTPPLNYCISSGACRHYGHGNPWVPDPQGGICYLQPLCWQEALGHPRRMAEQVVTAIQRQLPLPLGSAGDGRVGARAMAGRRRVLRPSEVSSFGIFCRSSCLLWSVGPLDTVCCLLTHVANTGRILAMQEFRINLTLLVLNFRFEAPPGELADLSAHQRILKVPRHCHVRLKAL